MMNMNLGTFIRNHKVGIVIFFLAITVRLALFFINLNANHGDFIATVRAADGYYEISQNLIAGNGYSDSPGPFYPPNYLRPPVWIFTMALIAGTFGSYVPVFIFVLLIGSFIPILGMYLAGKIVSRRLSIMTGFFLALEPNSVLNSTWFATEASFTFLFLVFSVFIFNYIRNQTTRSAIWAGLFLGLAILVKPTVQFLPILIPIFFFFSYRKKIEFIHFKHFLFFVIVSFAVITPWMYRNYYEFNRWSLGSQAAFNLYTVLVPTVLSIENGTSFETERASAWFRDSLKGVDITPANADYFTQKSLSVISQHKVAMIKSVIVSIITFFTHDGMLTVFGYAGIFVPNTLERSALALLFSEPIRLVGYIIRYIGTVPGAVIFISRILWVLFTIAFFCGSLWYYKREKKSLYYYYSLFVIVYFALITSVNGLGMNGRFRLPVLTYISLFAFYGFYEIWCFMKKKWFTEYE